MEAAQLKPGDILACYGTDRVSRTISFGTASVRRPRRLWLGPSHVGIVVEHPSRGLLVVESTSLCDHPCVFQGRRVSGAQAHYPEQRIGDYLTAGGRVDVWRLNPFWAFSDGESAEITQLLCRYFVGRHLRYDMRGAITSGTRVLCKVLSWLETDLETVFCSELLAFALMRLHRLPLDNATQFSPARLLRRLYALNVYDFAGPAELNFQVVRWD
jgi:hypothetical protein